MLTDEQQTGDRQAQSKNSSNIDLIVLETVEKFKLKLSSEEPVEG